MLLGIVVHGQLLGHYQETIQAYIVDNGYLYSIPRDSGSSRDQEALISPPVQVCIFAKDNLLACQSSP